MKNRCLILAACALTFGASAEYKPASYISSDFEGEYYSGITWKTYGVSASPAGEFAPYFQYYSPNYAYNVLSINNEFFAFSPSEFEGGEKSDEWIVSPEFTIADDEALIAMTTAQFGNPAKGNFKLLLSEGGDSKEDFAEELISNRVNGGLNQINKLEKLYVLYGYKGSKARLAFVNTGNTAGMLGLQSLAAGPYILDCPTAETLGNVVLKEEDMSLVIPVKLATCQRVNGLTAVLRTESGYECTYTSNVGFSSGYFADDNILFENIDLGDAIETGYTVTITPNYDGAPETVISGTLFAPVMKYPRVAVLEELTGTWCQWCPFGFGLLNYFNDFYKGTPEQGKVIGVAVHQGDVMENADITRYVEGKAQPFGFTGYPFIFVNRSAGTSPQDPICMQAVDLYTREKTFVKTEIKSVDLDLDSRNIKIAFDTEMSFDARQRPFSIYAMVLQNGMSGESRAWAQKNALSSYTSQYISEAYGPEVTPYLKDFIDGAPEWVYGLKFNDVARQVYPSEAGETKRFDFTAFEPQESSMEFTLDETVTSLGNLTVVVCLTDPVTGTIETADKLSSADFTVTGSGVEDVASEGGPDITVQSGRILVNAEEAGILTVYSPEGNLLREIAVAPGFNEIDMTGVQGVCIIRLAAGSQSRVVKAML